MKKLRVDFTQQTIALQNLILQIERNQCQNMFPPNNFNNDPLSNSIPPTSLESKNMVENFTYFCRGCQYFHDENTCVH